MSGPFPKELQQTAKVGNTVDDKRQHQQSQAGFAETDRGVTKDGRAGSPKTG